MHFLVHQFIWVHKRHKSSSMYSKSVVDVHSVLLHQFDLCTHRLESAKNSWKKTTLPLRVMQCPCAPFSLGAQAPKQVSLKMLRTGCPFRPCASTLACASTHWKMQRFVEKDNLTFLRAMQCPCASRVFWVLPVWKWSWCTGSNCMLRFLKVLVTFVFF